MCVQGFYISSVVSFLHEWGKISAESLVVIVHCHGKNLLCVLLTNHKAIQVVTYLKGSNNYGAKLCNMCYWQMVFQRQSKKFYKQ